MFRHNHSTYYVGTARFNPHTKLENEMYCKKHKISGCVYGFPIPISEAIPVNSNVFIIEMVNVSKQHEQYPGYVSGIGLITNHIQWKKDYSIYHNKEYNRHIYEGQYLLKREEMSEQQLKMTRRLDWILFHGSSHMKRSTWVTKIPNDIFECVPLQPLLIDILENTTI